MDINTVVVVGRLVKDPETTTIPSGAIVGNLSIAVNRVSSKDGVKTEEVSFFNVTVWNKLAEVVAQYTKKGSRVAISGRLRQRRWSTNEGEKRSVVEIVADSVQFLDSRQESGAVEPDISDEVPY